MDPENTLAYSDKPGKPYLMTEGGSGSSWERPKKRE